MELIRRRPRDASVGCEYGCARSYDVLNYRIGYRDVDCMVDPPALMQQNLCYDHAKVLVTYLGLRGAAASYRHFGEEVYVIG